MLTPKGAPGSSSEVDARDAKGSIGQYRSAESLLNGESAIQKDLLVFCAML